MNQDTEGLPALNVGAPWTPQIQMLDLPLVGFKKKSSKNPRNVLGDTVIFLIHFKMIIFKTVIKNVKLPISRILYK